MHEDVDIYTRVSSVPQTDNKSLDEQERICRDYCARQPSWRVDKVFREEGESARSADRTALQAMLEHCRASKGKIKHIVVYKIDRFSRKVEDHMALRAILKKMGVMLWSATEPINETTTGTLMENVLASFAQFDNDLRSERSRGGMRARALEGCWVSGAPIGFVNVKDELKRPTLAQGDKDKDIVKAVQKFFNEFATGKYRQSEAHLIAKKCGVRTKAGIALSRNGATGLLKNIVYAGYIQNGLTDNQLIKGLHYEAAIVNLELFQTVQAVLSGPGSAALHLSPDLSPSGRSGAIFGVAFAGNRLQAAHQKGDIQPTTVRNAP